MPTGMTWLHPSIPVSAEGTASGLGLGTSGHLGHAREGGSPHVPDDLATILILETQMDILSIFINILFKFFWERTETQLSFL